jgi:hypothetical protein
LYSRRQLSISTRACARLMNQCSFTGTDTLVVYDGNDAVGVVSASSIVLAGVTPAQLSIVAGNYFIGMI